EEGGGGGGRLRRVHRQPHDRGLRATGRAAVARGVPAAAARSCAREFRHGDGSVPHGGPGRARRRRLHPSPPLRRAPGHAALDHCRHAGRAPALRPEERGRLLPLSERLARGAARPRGEEIILAQARSRGVARRAIGDEEIVQRCVFALVNEGARILEEGIAQRASDIDIVYLTGYGFPAYRGGPMFYADSIGLHAVLYALRRFAANPYADPGAWQPAPLLARLGSLGKTFNDSVGGKPT